MEKPLSFHHFQWPGHGARLSSSRFGWQSRGRGSLRLSFVPWAALKYGGFGWWSWRLLTSFCLIWWGHKGYMHNEWHISAGIHMYVVYTCILYTSLHWYNEYWYIPFIHRHAHNPVNNKSPKSGVFAYDSKAKKRFPFPCRYLRPGHGLCETDGLYHGVGKSQLGLETMEEGKIDLLSIRWCMEEAIGTLWKPNEMSL